MQRRKIKDCTIALVTLLEQTTSTQTYVELVKSWWWTWSPTEWSGWVFRFLTQECTRPPVCQCYDYIRISIDWRDMKTQIKFTSKSGTVSNLFGYLREGSSESSRAESRKVQSEALHPIWRNIINLTMCMNEHIDHWMIFAAENKVPCFQRARRNGRKSSSSKHHATKWKLSRVCESMLHRHWSKWNACG